MGNSLGATKTEEEFLNEFEEVRRESDAQFGSVTIYKSKRNPKLLVLMKEKVFTSQEELRSYIAGAKTRS